MFYYLGIADNEWFRYRIKLFLITVFCVFVILLSRLFYLQIINGEEFRSLSEQNSLKFNTIYSSRGLIFDRNGKLLVENRPSFDLFINISEGLRNIEEVIKKISSISSLDYETMLSNFHLSKFSKCKKFILLKSDIDRASLSSIRANGYNLPGIEINISSKRNYIYGSSLSHLLGYIGEVNSEDLEKDENLKYKIGDIIGKYGIEKTKDIELRGKCGGFWSQVNAVGEIVKNLDLINPIPGLNVTLTIDHDLQLAAESILADKIGALVAINPSSGEVLAMVSSPSYDQNIFISGISKKEWASMASNPMKLFTNKTIQGQYPPASIYKIVTAVAGLEEDIIKKDTKILCQGFHNLGDRNYLCWKANGHKDMNIISALAESCDVFFYTLGQKLGVDCLGYYARLFGLGSPSGIDLDEEAIGLVPTSDWKKLKYGKSWQLGETLSVAIGQSFNLVTPLQMAVMVSSIANGGSLNRPLIIKNINDSSGNICYESSKDVVRILPFKDETIKIIQESLYQAVKHKRGTAKTICSDWIEISGKTGTAQIVGRETYNNALTHSKGCFRNHAWFVGYSPSKNPKIALAVIIEHGGNGSRIAAPIGANIIKYYISKKNNE